MLCPIWGFRQTCTCTGVVWYGAEQFVDDLTKWSTQPSVGSIGCTNGVFGDPAPGVAKSCYCDTMYAAPRCASFNFRMNQTAGAEQCKFYAKPFVPQYLKEHSSSSGHKQYYGMTVGPNCLPL